MLVFALTGCARESRTEKWHRLQRDLYDMQTKWDADCKSKSRQLALRLNAIGDPDCLAVESSPGAPAPAK